MNDMRARLLTLLVGMVWPLAAFAEPSVLRQSGDCTIVRAQSNEPGIVKVVLKNVDVEILCKFREAEFAGSNVILANADFTSLAGKELDVSYNVAFFSKDGELIGSASQNGTSRVDGRTKQFGSCIIPTPTAEVRKVSSFKVVVYIGAPKPKK